MFKQRRPSLKLFLAVACAFLLGGALTYAAAELTGSLIVSDDGQRLFQVQQVRPSYLLPGMQGILALQDGTGCYIVWNRRHVQVMKCGWTNGHSSFDCTPVWGRDFVEDIKTVVPLGEKSTAFVVETVNTHTVFKADWFKKG